MIKNITITVAFKNGQVRLWGYDRKFFDTDSALFNNIGDDFSDDEEHRLKGVLYASVVILKENDELNNFVIHGSEKSTKYKAIIESQAI